MAGSAPTRASPVTAARRAPGSSSITSSRKREAAAEEARVRTAAAVEVVPWLRGLGLRAEEARRAAERCQAIPDAPLEERVRYALRGWHR
jgi:hypothetical protein